MIGLFICMLLTMPAKANDSPPVHSLSEVHHMYVDSMGHDDEAARFRGLVKQELTRAGFTIEDNSAKADAILSGTISIRVLAGYSRAFSDVTLRASDGAALWQSAFRPRFWHGKQSGDDVKDRATDIAAKFLQDFKQSTPHH